MYLVSEVACLDERMKNGLLYDTGLRQDTSAINRQLHSIETCEMNMELLFNSNGSPDVELLKKIITRAFRLAAQIYLYSLDPDFSAEKPHCVELVEEITTSIFQRLPSGPTGFDRCLVWPYVISGSVCTASSDLRRLINNRIEELGVAAKFGSFSGLVTVLREVWRRVDSPLDVSGNKINISWRHVMEEMGWDYLLI
ncbi:fungal-specific transcription factor domain-containing protein [Annulohypoxylon truncatum]|uniref:fungal-specific transcription factor domain-containing protein n=1 Tax=Annulohypoxylon truncatum TaxID=327061 RepID=UPI002007D6AF|nr:fungal-specific transcription factor domain-containing protein [Annulohypoxylon truncatum]KAI1210696.1 fungal-specific transcription factor domain-containing protein [Annulohypoxylon truncatum]